MNAPFRLLTDYHPGVVLLLVCILAGPAGAQGRRHNTASAIGSLRDTSIQADYVVICAANFRPQAERLADYRTTHGGFLTRVALIESVSTEFETGSADSSLRAFVRYALSHWRVPYPKYFVLAGNINTLPPHKEAPLLNVPPFTEDSIVVDSWYVAADSGASPLQNAMAALGRLPAWTPQQLDTAVSKIISYEQAPAGIWLDRSLSLADSDFADSLFFEFFADSFQAITRRIWPDTTRIDIRRTSPRYGDVGSFLSRWEDGEAVMMYVGHANPWQFSQSHYWDATQVAGLTNAPRLPVGIFLACSQEFSHPDSPSIVQRLVLQSGGGAIATVAFSGLAYASEEFSLLERVLTRICTSTPTSIGSAVQNALTDPALGYVSETARRVTILGDPALIPRRPGTALIRNPHEPLPGGCALLQNYPNPFNPKTVVSYQLSVASKTTIVVYDMLGREIVVLINERKDPGLYEVMWDASGVPSGVYICRMTAGNFSQARKMVLVK